MMKNRIKVLLFLLLTGITANSALAQKNSWTLGFNLGTIGTLYQKGNLIDTYNRNVIKYEDAFPFSFELTTSYGITNHISITTGVAYLYKEVSVKRLSWPFINTFNNK